MHGEYKVKFKYVGVYVRCLVLDFTKVVIGRQILVKISNTRFNENVSGAILQKADGHMTCAVEIRIIKYQEVPKSGNKFISK
jgi:hypothetical protein